MRTLKRIALALVLIGAINWGLIGFFQFDLVAALFGGQTSGFSRIIYALVGLSGLVCIGLFFERVTDGDNTENFRGIESRNLDYRTEFAEDENDDFDR